MSDSDTDVGAVLVVEDEDVVLGIACRMLEAIGRETAAASTGAEALAILAKGPVAGILLDLTLPDMKGRELFDAVRAACADAQLVVTSGYDREAVTRDIDLGDAVYLAKPYSLADIQRLFSCAS